MTRAAAAILLRCFLFSRFILLLLLFFAVSSPGRAHALVAVAPPADRHGCLVDSPPAEAALRAALRPPPAMPVLRAASRVEPAAAAQLAGRRVLPFSGTARPRRFFDTLRALGCTVREPCALPDHAPIPAATLERLRRAAARDGAPWAWASMRVAAVRALHRWQRVAGARVALPRGFRLFGPPKELGVTPTGGHPQCGLRLFGPIKRLPPHLIALSPQILARAFELLKQALHRLRPRR